MNARDNVERRDSDPHAYSRQFDNGHDTTAFDRHFAPLLRPLAPPQSEVHNTKPLHVVTMEEQRRIAHDIAFALAKQSGAALRYQIDRAHVRELDSGLHNLHEPFEGLIR